MRSALPTSPSCSEFPRWCGRLSPAQLRFLRLTPASCTAQARNEEKAQCVALSRLALQLLLFRGAQVVGPGLHRSMLFRFREAKAASLGLSTNMDRRPRIAATCTDLRQCERWRGEILREVSRKVSKIQDRPPRDFSRREEGSF